MIDLLSRLLDLDTLRLGEAGVGFDFERPLPVWMWVNVAVGAMLLAAWSYRRQDSPLWARSVLAGVRALLLIVIAVMAAGPRLVERTESVERDWVLVLLDRSASMRIGDAPGGGAREEQLRRALERSSPMWRELSASKDVVWLGFDGGAYDLAPGEDAVPSLEEPEGRRTALGAALAQAVRRAAARPLSGVLVVSDGRSVDEPSTQTVRRLQADKAPVHTLSLGSAEPVGDVAALRVTGPDVAFVRDVAPVTVELVRTGADTPVGATLRLVDAATGETLTERRVEVGGEPQEFTLTHTPTEPGETVWRVEVAPDGQDLIEGNNSADVRVELVDRPMRILYVDGSPRWEQRYLRNLLIRESSIVASTLILSPDRRYLQEGDIEIDALPDSPERWAEYDVVLLGDVLPSVFTEAQLQSLREHVATRGAGLLWIAGAGATPNAWWDTALADLLPVSSSGGRVEPVGEGVVMRATPLAERLGVLRMGDEADDAWPEMLADPTSGWSVLRWAQRLDPAALKPAVEVLASGSVAWSGGGDEEPTPLVLSMRYGAGRTLYVATDEIWRWRYGRGEALPERFWVQMIRFLGRESLARTGRAATLSVSPRQSAIEQPVRIALELLDQSLLDAGLRSVEVRIELEGAEGDGAAARAELTLRQEPGSPGRFAGTWVPPEAGTWTVRPTEPALSGLGLRADVVVTLPGDELRRPETDHDLLARLREATGGRDFDAASLSDLPDDLPNRQVRLVRERSEALWDTPLALLVVMTLLLTEWVGRRLVRLM